MYEEDNTKNEFKKHQGKIMLQGYLMETLITRVNRLNNQYINIIMKKKLLTYNMKKLMPLQLGLKIKFHLGTPLSTLFHKGLIMVIKSFHPSPILSGETMKMGNNYWLGEKKEQSFMDAQSSY